MKTRTTFITIAALAVLTIAATAFAGPGFARGGWGCGGPGYGYGHMGYGPGNGHMGYGNGYAMGPGMMYGYGQGGPGPALTQEQAAAIQGLSNEYNNKTAELRGKLYTKNVELQTAFAADKVDQNKVKSLSKDIGELRSQLFQIKNEYRAKLAAEGIGRNGYGPGNAPYGCPFYGPDGDDS